MSLRESCRLSIENGNPRVQRSKIKLQTPNYRWVAGAALVNAFYSPNTNEISECGVPRSALSHSSLLRKIAKLVELLESLVAQSDEVNVVDAYMQTGAR